MSKKRLSTRKKRVEWDDSEVRHLLDIWKDKVAELKRAKRNSEIFTIISLQLKKFNIVKGEIEISNKISNLTKKFRAERKNIYKTGGTPSTWKYYEKINEIIGTGSLRRNTETLETETMMTLNESTLSSSVDNSQNISISTLPFIKPKEEVISNSSIDLTLSGSSISESISSTRNSSRKKRDHSLQKDILHEIKRTNKIVKNELRRANKLSKTNIKIQKQILKILSSMKSRQMHI